MTEKSNMSEDDENDLEDNDLPPLKHPGYEDAYDPKNDFDTDFDKDDLHDAVEDPFTPEAIALSVHELDLRIDEQLTELNGMLNNEPKFFKTTPLNQMNHKSICNNVANKLRALEQQVKQIKAKDDHNKIEWRQTKLHGLMTILDECIKECSNKNEANNAKRHKPN